MIEDAAIKLIDFDLSQQHKRGDAAILNVLARIIQIGSHYESATLPATNKITSGA